MNKGRTKESCAQIKKNINNKLFIKKNKTNVLGVYLMDDMTLIMKTFNCLSESEKKEQYKKKQYMKNCIELLNEHGINATIETTMRYNLEHHNIVNDYKIVIWHKTLVWVGKGKRKKQSYCDMTKCKNMDDCIQQLNMIIDQHQIQRHIGKPTKASKPYTTMVRMWQDTINQAYKNGTIKEPFDMQQALDMLQEDEETDQ